MLMNLDLEKEVIASFFRDYEVCNEYALSLDPSDLSDKLFRNIFTYIKSKLAESTTVVSLSEVVNEFSGELKSKNYLWDIKEDYQYLCPKNTIKTLKFHTLAREAYNASLALHRDLKAAKPENFRDVLIKYADIYSNLCVEAKKDNSTYTTTNNLAAVTKDLSERRDKFTKGLVVENLIKSGFYDLDKLIGGFQTGQFVVIGGRPAGGKTTFMINLIKNMKNYRSVVLTMEMQWLDLVKKIIFSETNVSYQKAQEGRLTESDLNSIYEAEKRLQKQYIHFDEATSVKPAEMFLKLKRLKETENIDIVFIDYLQLMKPDKQLENNQVNVASISRELKKIAKLLKIPIVALAQVNRNSEQNSITSPPKVSDLRESGSIEADADCVMLLYQQPTKPNSLDVIVGKNRFGATGTVNLNWNKSTGGINNSTSIEDKKSIYDL